MEGHDLRQYQDNDEIKNIFGKIVSGREGYETVIDKTVEVPRCQNCDFKLRNDEKFCPECGTKAEVKE